MVLNYFKLFLIPNFAVMGLVMAFLPLESCFRLRLVSLARSVAFDPTLRGSFEIQFLKAVIAHRRVSGSAPEGSSRLGPMLCHFLQSKFRLTKEQERELAFNQQKSTKRSHISHLNLSADTASLTGIAFEIQKDVDRTFQDSAKFSQQHRNSLATILKAYATLDCEIGYVQGLNFIVGNFIRLFARDATDYA